MTGRCKSKTRKPLETALGKAPKDSERAADLAHLRKPIETSVFGLKQVLSLLQTATSEVREYITYECDVLYECRTCRSIFRSLANFILHKREYCREKFSLDGHHNQGGGFVVAEDSQTLPPPPPPPPNENSSRCATPEEKDPKKTILPIIDKLLKRQKIRLLAKDTLSEDLSKDENSDDDVIFVSEENNVILQKIDTSEAAVFQTVVKEGVKTEENEGLIKSEVMEIHGILENNEAVMDSTGKVCTFETSKPKQELVCTECNFTFSTEKTLTHHIKYKHNQTCIVYPCPDCSETLSNAWSVYRHLYNVHRRTSAQIRRMRDLIHSSRVRKSQKPPPKTPPEEEKQQRSESEENQWMNNFERDKDLQMCGGCGKRFERKAALHSHSQMCTKRIALCNSLKKGKAGPSDKRAEKGGARGVQGAAKRKPALVSTYKRTSEAKAPVGEVLTISDDSSEVPETLNKKRLKWDFDPKLADISDEYKTYLNDETDHCFLAKAQIYMDKAGLKCIPCGSSFVSVYLLLRHMSVHFSWFRFQCSKCSFMSFHKYDCTTHASNQHSVPNAMMESTVLPIPKWKVLCSSHDFEQVVEEMPPQLEKCEKSEAIVLEDDEMPVLLLDDGKKGEEEEEKAGPSKGLENSRPVRNRTKSVKTVQDDFIYDLNNVLKLNDHSIKNRRMKKNLNK
ncbi:hypothetical protein TcasGA2_TC011044 [Tribolium castaneum]|uniref:C2H2-type domain-containing protein n=1 Tax=Tribolium castaneum TaxID=7070 RepID=D6X4T4_TRICA|nr:PREDICTED: zinc finger protein 800 [Tribolium castaneum]XP_966362.3 PREDICTED: zinc finger protein 800 [Tribolium castaneum]EEZ97246.1 hypothetical protein TcasGA2_TC011044 [Tribolium castaneum]|eukprot:XP_008198885.1 PREDICTED: zinc finger protein 800 [Tribolium castaneum]